MEKNKKTKNKIKCFSYLKEPEAVETSSTSSLAGATAENTQSNTTEVR